MVNVLASFQKKQGISQRCAFSDLFREVSEEDICQGQEKK